MTRDEFNAFCGSLPQSTHVIQWGNSDVWKVGGKLYALSGWHENDAAFTFKVSDMAFQILPDMDGLHPAQYLASRGLKWIQYYAEPGLSDAELRNHITYSCDMVVAKLTKENWALDGPSA